MGKYNKQEKLFTIADDKELIMGSTMYTGEDLTSGGLVHNLWTNDYSHITIMKEFLEKVWSDSTPAKFSPNQ